MPSNFYKINFEREVVLQDKSTTFLSINRNDDIQGMPNQQDLVILVYPQGGTFNTFADVTLTYLEPDPTIANGRKFTITGYNESLSVQPDFNRIKKDLIVENWYDFDSNGSLALNPAGPPLIVKSFDRGNNVLTLGTQDGTAFIPPIGVAQSAKLGVYDESDFDNWRINGGKINEINNSLLPPPTGIAQYFNAKDTQDPNPFDGSKINPFTYTYGSDTGFIGRSLVTWSRIPYSAINNSTNGVTFQIDYDGVNNSHIKLVFYIVSIPNVLNSNLLDPPTSTFPPYGVKDVVLTSSYDYQEVHLFGYTKDYVKTSRDNSLIDLPINSPLYDDNISYGLLKTNPKLSGNVKLTVDSNGSLSLNSFNANNELSDSSYKKFAVSENSTYQKDLYEFFKKGTTPSEIIFDVYEVDNQYLNTKRTYDQQFDNFYNYGVEQLNSKFYDENFSFLAPIWLRKEVPDYFVIFRVDGPINPDTYVGVATEENFNTYFKNARIIKTFDMRESSKLGSYIRKIVTDSRFKERPLEVSWENDIATYWYGISYQNGALTSKGEFLYDYYKKDRPIKEFEEFITSGFQRNGIISSNLINLEFLFDDEEAPLYGINRYFGLYVKENQLAEFEIEPTVLGKIYEQTPSPKIGVDGQPYSLREFTQTNPKGIQIPVHYYHNTSYENNTSIVPNYVGYVDGKFPLPNMVEDPMRFFYVKDRNDVFKRINKITEVDYGTANTDDYIRATQLQVFDTQENMSVYGGVTNIVSQFPAKLLNSGNSQLRIHLNDYYGTGVLADDESIVFEVKRYTDQDDRTHTYYFQVSQQVLGTNLTIQYFVDQDVQPLLANFNQPAIGGSVSLQVNDGTLYKTNETIYIVGGGYYKVLGVTLNQGNDNVQVSNLGGGANSPAGTNIAINSLIGRSLSGSLTYTANSSTELSIDNYLTLNLIDFNTGYQLRNAWRVDVNYPSVEKFKVIGTRNIDVIYKPAYDKFKWVLTANPIGMPPGDAWDYPMFTPGSNDFVSTFSNEGTPTQVAQAIVKCINSFENSPVKACSVNNVIYMSSNFDYEDGNTVLFTRQLTEKSYYANLGFYVDGNVEVKPTIDLKTYSGLSQIDLSPKFTEKLDTPMNKGYYFKIRKNSSGAVIQGKIGCNPSSYAAGTTTGLSYWKVITNNTLIDSALPFSLDLTNIPADNNFYEFIYEADSNSNVNQFFIGGVKRNRNRARISTANATNYYDNKKVSRIASTVNGSNVIYVDTSDLYISAPISGKGIPSGSKVIDVNNSSIVIDKLATLTSSSNVLEIGEISPLNRKPLLQQWYQAQKGVYSRMKAWDVQGQILYTLPDFETPVYNEAGDLINFKNAEDFSIIQLENATQEFYISNDDRVVAWNVYRPLFGMFSVYPVKQFDFDFIFSDYSYSPINEALTYFKEYNLKNDESVDLSLFENYVFDVTTRLGTQLATADFSIEISVYNKDTFTWYVIDTLNLNNTVAPPDTNPTKARFLFNTFYPIYVYDANEFPFMSPYGYSGRANPTDYFLYNYTKTPQNKAVGKRNFNKRYLRTYNDVTGNYEIFYPKEIRVTFKSSGGKLNIKNYNYSNDKDLEFFTGFAGLQDIQNSEDIAKIESLKDSGDYVSAYTYQLLLSEYDRLRENYNKDFAVSSIVVPYINKWVQEGTDARENYYRLNNSSAFGITNISPSSQIDFAEPSMFTQEFPYIDSTPKDFYTPGYVESRSYMFEKLTDVAYNGKTWYELLTSNDDNDWFLKYFSVGYPTEFDEIGARIKKPREERYTFLKYNEGTGKNQTIFRGAKIQGLVLDDTILTNITEIENSKELDGYKFSAIAQFLKPESVTYEIDKPYKFEIIKNEKYKTLLMIITVYYDDYRMQHGHYDYMSQYFMTDLLKNSNNSQLKLFTNKSVSAEFLSYNFIPYNGTFTYANASAQTTLSNVLRPRQGFLGGGYLDLNNKKLSSIIDYSGFTQTNYDINTGQFNNVTFKQIFPNFPNLLDELNTTQNSYRLSDVLITSMTSYPYIYNPFLINVAPIASQQAKDGFFYGLSVDASSGNGVSIGIRMFLDSQNNNPAIQPESINFGTGLFGPSFSVTDTPLLRYPLLQAGIDTSGVAVTSSIGQSNEKKTFSIEGGSKGYESIQSFISFSNIQTLINSNLVIEYYKVINNSKQTGTDFKLSIVNPDEIIKNNVLQYTEDTDKPQEYLDAELIGFNIVDTNMNEYLVRHRGYYEPKTRDVLSFWVREDNEMSKHYQKDFLLNNTHIASNTVYSGLMRNYGFNKVATSGEVLKVTRAAAYKSLYPLLGEVAVTNGNLFAIDSSWDANYYQDYSTTTDYIKVNGIKEMRELKSFLASKAMNVPKSHEMHTFISDEVQFNLTGLATPLGVPQLIKNKKNASQNKSDANKPVLTINIDVKKRLLRQLIEDIDSGLYVDEFNKLPNYLIEPTALSDLTAADIKKLKTSYLEKNILDLYEVTELNVFSLKKQGIEIVNLELTEQEKTLAGYKIDKNCKVVKNSDFTYTITIVLDSKDPVGFSLSTTVKRI